MMANELNTLNALMAGSDDDAIFLAPYGEDLLKNVKLFTEISAPFVNCGWVHSDGFSLPADDSTSEITGHQGGKVVRNFMDSSKTSLEVTLLETKLEVVQWAMSATATKTTEQNNGKSVDVARLAVPRARKVERLTGIVDIYDATSGADAKIRILMPAVELGERDTISFKRGDIIGYKYTLNFVEDFEILSNHKGLIPKAGAVTPGPVQP